MDATTTDTAATPAGGKAPGRRRARSGREKEVTEKFMYAIAVPGTEKDGKVALGDLCANEGKIISEAFVKGVPYYRVQKCAVVPEMREGSEVILKGKPIAE